MHGGTSGRHTNTIRLVVIMTVAILFVLFVKGYAVEALEMYERAALTVFPSAERAYAYGNRHFDARLSGFYDIEHAQKMYLSALALDPSHGGVRHQLGRVAFLRGEFPTAMSYLNEEIALPGGPVSTSTYYMRGLVQGYMGAYDAAIVDYTRYIESDPTSWAARTDCAWVMLKNNDPARALALVDGGLSHFPHNPWLLNTKAIALFELGRVAEAHDAAVQAKHSVEELTEEQWLTAYPGNDPRVAGEGIRTLQSSIEGNLVKIQASLSE
jgi:tetratricopeptide (TPR) repeat protein